MFPIEQVVDRAGLALPRHFNSLLLATPLIRATAARRVPAYLANRIDPPPRRIRKTPATLAGGARAGLSIGVEKLAQPTDNGRAAQ